MDYSLSSSFTCTRGIFSTPWLDFMCSPTGPKDMFTGFCKPNQIKLNIIELGSFANNSLSGKQAPLIANVVLGGWRRNSSDIDK